MNKVRFKRLVLDTLKYYSKIITIDKMSTSQKEEKKQCVKIMRI